ncbi:microtubule-associated protein 6 homolog [Phycodurus eques]|uniref:microtubule-associated protein 6 homolog n=1 Tax=Phycodurus eques TaxID=693459 RepID=UPI002ACEB264|nr:microtubule-associated protein 6 homolog [Phycodurus eques]
MAWPCISRVCCLARFWNQFDKSDLSVPLTIQNYSDISEHEVRSVTKQVFSASSAPGPRGAAGSPTRGSFKARREPSYKPREDYQPPDVPFPSVTQYKQDFKPWPIPRKDHYPWISNGDSPGGRLEVKEEDWSSSYRQECRPWAKSTRKQLATESPETSYQAAYSGEAHRSIGPHQGGITSASTNIQPASVRRPVLSTPQAGPSYNPLVLHSIQHEKTELSTSTKGQEHLDRTKLPPNPSAVFQSGSRAF